MGERLVVSRLISDHCVLQHGKPVHIWGRTAPGRSVCVLLSKESEAARGDEVKNETRASSEGAWSVFLPAMKPSKDSCRLVITDDGGERIEIHDVLIGEVWFASGQSNMDLMMERVKDRYPVEVATANNPYIRAFKIAEQTDYHGPLDDPLTGEWKAVASETILSFSATGYFFAKNRFHDTGIPVGFLHASLGGSLISCWMSREMLSSPSEKAPEGYPLLIADADRYADDKFRMSQIEKNAQNDEEWNAELAKRRGNAEGAGSAGEISIPCLFSNISELNEYIGEISLKKTITLTEQMIAEMGDCRVRLFLGTMVDRDVTYVNGVKVGETGYQYPPRKYEVPKEILHPGENEMEIRLVVENGKGRLTPGKKYALICEKADAKICRDTGGFEIKEPGDACGAEDADGQGVLWELDLSGAWQFKKIARMDTPVPPTDFISWHATGLYNAMAAPCHRYTILGIIWYQGESNADHPWNYEDLQRRLMRGWRKKWHEGSEQETLREGDDTETIPFLYVQLPNFRIDLNGEGEKRWEEIRQDQSACLSEPLSGMITTMGLGCDNDLHPHEKEEIGKRLASLLNQLGRSHAANA